MPRKVSANQSDLIAFMRSMRAVEDTLRHISAEDAKDIADDAVSFLRSIFPKSKGSRKDFFPRGSREPQNRGTPLYSGWRKYQTADSTGAGYMIAHARVNQPRIRTILASLDQGARAHTIFAKRGWLRFIQNGKLVFAQSADIPRRAPQPGPDGYIAPTRAFIESALDRLASQRAEDLAAAARNKSKRITTLRDRYSELQKQKIVRRITNE